MRRPICLLLALLLLLSACGQAVQQPASEQPAPELPAEHAAPSETAVTFTDDLGREVTVDDPQRVAPLIGSFADIWCLAGGQDTLVATANDAWTSFDLSLSDDVVDLGATTEISLERLIAAAPDFVIGSCNTAIDLELEDTLTEMGIPVAYFQVDAFADYLRMLEILTQITGRDDLYACYGDEVQRQVESAKALADGSAPTVLYICATGSSVKVKNSQGSVLGEMLADLGCVNVADSENSLLENLSLEAILTADPDNIFLVYQGSDPTNAEQRMEETLLSNPAWATLRAVKEGRCFRMDPSLYNLKPNGRWGIAYEQLAELLYGAPGTDAEG